MIRIKSNNNKRKRIKKILKNSKGYHKSNLYKISKQKFTKSLSNQFISRKLKKRVFRSKWIKFLNLFLKNINTRYSLFISSLKKQSIALNRKILYFILIKDILDFNLKKL